MEKKLIFKDFIQDREVQMYSKHFSNPDRVEYIVCVQVFVTDNLPFSSRTGKPSASFNYDHASTENVLVSGFEGDYLNPITKKYEVTDHTFVIGRIKDNHMSQTNAVVQMTSATGSIIHELSKHMIMPNMVRPKILSDVDRAQRVIMDRNIKISQLSKESSFSANTLYNYRKNPASLKKASNSVIQFLVTKYYEKYFSRNEIERFRFMLIRIVLAYLKENKKEQADFEPVYELYKMCQKADYWRHLAKMEEVWRAFYSVDTQF